MKFNYLNFFIISISVWLLQNAQLIIAEAIHDPAQGEFSTFVYKGPLSYCDVLTYAGHVQHAAKHPSLLRPDGLIKENGDLFFADGNIINVYGGWILKLVQDIDLVPIIGSVIPTLLSVLFIMLLTKRLMGEEKLLYQFGLSIILLLSNFDDFFGIGKFIEGFILHAKEMDDIMPMGYNQRFLYGQFSNVIFLFWLYALIEWIFERSIKNQFLLGFALVLCHFTYFYYWSAALPITIGFLVLKPAKLKTFLTLGVVYFIGSIYYWINFIDFNSTTFAAEYLERVQGPQFFPGIWILVIGVISGYSIILKNTKIGLALYTFPVVCMYLFKKINYVFPEGDLKLFLALVVCLLLLFLLIYSVVKIHFSKLELLNVFNYYLMFIFINLAYVIGYNVQPYHWAYTTYYTVLSFCVVGFLRQFLPQVLFNKIFKVSITLIVVLGICNSYRFAERNAAFWNLSMDDKEVISFIDSQENTPVIGGNNIMALITFTAHSNAYIYTGTTCHSRSSSHELHHRFIKTYKTLNYSDAMIIAEYKKYEKHTEYWEVYHSYDEKNRVKLGADYPNNITLTAEALHHYFLTFEEKIPQLKAELKAYDKDEFSFEWDYIIIHKPTLESQETSIHNKIVFENDTYIVVVK